MAHSDGSIYGIAFSSPLTDYLRLHPDYIKAPLAPVTSNDEDFSTSIPQSFRSFRITQTGCFLSSFKVIQVIQEGRRRELKKHDLIPTRQQQRRSQVFEIPSYIAQKHFTNALGDCCAKYNFMSEDYALSLGLSVDRQRKHQVTIGSRTEISTAGTATTTFQFQDESESYHLVFHLLPNCIHNVILGKPFLKATRTFSAVNKFALRVKQRILKGIRESHLLYLGDSAPRFEGLINGIPHEALADSGARVMIMDEVYAQSIGLSINNRRGNRTKLRFPDGSTTYTSGMIYGVGWEFGPGGQSDRHLLDFHVLKNAPANVILSDACLFGTKAFSQYNCYLIDDDDDDEDAFFFAIDIDTRYPNQQSGATVSTADAKYFELVRRGEEEDRIAALPFALQAAAWVVENERRGKWDRMQATLQHCPQSLLPSGPSSASSTPVIPGGTSILSSLGSQQQSSSSASKSRFRWRFKLKRKNAT